jgi:hypothetical protein
MKKLIVFDLDGTLAESKSPLDVEMAGLPGELIGIVTAAVISGGDWLQFETQVLSHLPRTTQLTNPSILPTYGTRFYRYSHEWTKIYSEDFTAAEKTKIIASLNTSVAESGVKVDKLGGGAASIDVTRPGIDKAYGIGKLKDVPGISIREMMYIGDALFPCGNDYPAEPAGVVSVCVRAPHEAMRVVETAIGCLT